MNQIKPNRPILKLKKRVIVSVEESESIVPVPVPLTVSTPAPKLLEKTAIIEKIVKAIKPPKATKPKPKPSSEKEAVRLENIRLGSEAAAKKRACTEMVKPLIEQYFAENPIFREMVVIDNVECLKPLMIGARKSFFQIIKNHPDAQNCTNTVLNDLISAILIVHTKKLPYINGLVKFNDRFDLDGNPAGAISEEHKTKAQVKANNIYKKTSKISEISEAQKTSSENE